MRNALLGSACVWFLALSPVQAQTAQLPQPKTADLQKAEALLEDVFGKEIRSARTAAERAKVAREILQAAKEETDPANKLACLQQARQLAIAALDGPLGLEITREIVEAFAPLEEMTFEARLAEADRVWQQAEKATGHEKLSRQLTAAENYLYLLPKASSLVKTKIEKRLAELGGINQYSKEKIAYAPDLSKGNWIWGRHLPSCILQKDIGTIAEGVRVFVAITADDYYELYVNKNKVGSDGDWYTVELYEITPLLKKDGINIVTIFAKDVGGVAGVWGVIGFQKEKEIFKEIRTDMTWATPIIPLESLDWDRLAKTQKVPAKIIIPHPSWRMIYIADPKKP